MAAMAPSAAAPAPCAEAKVEVVLRLLTHRFGPLSATAAARVSAASLEELDRLVDRVLTAQSLEDALG
jgi:hypothetical protein